MPEDSFGFRGSEETNRPQGASFQGNSGLQPFHFFPSGDAVTGLQGLGRGYISISWAALDLNSKCGSLSPSSTACSHPWGCRTAPPGPTVPAAASDTPVRPGHTFQCGPRGEMHKRPCAHSIHERDSFWEDVGVGTSGGNFGRGPALAFGKSCSLLRTSGSCSP